MKHVIHVHQQKIKKGEPAIIHRTYKGSTHHRWLVIEGPCVIVQADTPDRCGARIWIETEGNVREVGHPDVQVETTTIPTKPSTTGR